MTKNIDIKAVVLDVDGVINGTLDDINTPFPHKDVVAGLRQIEDNGMPVIFCTSKGIFPIREIVEKFGFHGKHIVDGGAIIYDAENNEVSVESIESENAARIVSGLESGNNYFEVYTADNWYILDRFSIKYIDSHIELLRKEPVRLKSFNGFFDNSEIKVSKIIYFTEDGTEADVNKKFIADLGEGLDYKWTRSPVLEPADLLIITKAGTSKKKGLTDIAGKLNIPMENFLGIGDNQSDWGFMEICGYVGAMGNSSQELMDLVKTKEEGKYIVGGDVDDNGILDIFKYYKLL